MLSYEKKARITTYKDIQVLDVELTFGENEANMQNRTLDINIDDSYQLQFSITNAKFDIISFENNSSTKLQLKSITPTYDNSYYIGYEYNVHLYLKFPLDTFSKSDKNINLTFNEYNMEVKNNNIEFTSALQFANQEKIQTEKNVKINIFLKIIIFLIVCVFIFRHFDLSIIYNSCVKRCLKDGIIYRDGWQITRYDYGEPLKIVRTYRFKETNDANSKDFSYYRKDRYSPKKIYEIVNGKEIMSYQISSYKQRVKKDVNQNYINSYSLTMALADGMPDKIEYKVIWLRQKIFYTQGKVANGPEKSLQTWHGPYGWRYESTASDMREFESLERRLRDFQTELGNLKKEKSDNENEWYWSENCF